MVIVDASDTAAERQTAISPLLPLAFVPMHGNKMTHRRSLLLVGSSAPKVFFYFISNDHVCARVIHVFRVYFTTSNDSSAHPKIFSTTSNGSSARSTNFSTRSNDSSTRPIGFYGQRAPQRVRVPRVILVLVRCVQPTRTCPSLASVALGRMSQ